MADSRNFEHEFIQKSVVGRHVADDDPEVIVSIARRRKAFQNLWPLANARDEFGYELLVVAVERDMKDGRH